MAGVSHEYAVEGANGDSTLTACLVYTDGGKHSQQEDAAVGGCTIKQLEKEEAGRWHCGARLLLTPPRPGKAEIRIFTVNAASRPLLVMAVDVRPSKYFVWGHPTLKTPGEGAADRDTPLYGEISHTGVSRILRGWQETAGLDERSCLLEAGSGRGKPCFLAKLVFGVGRVVGVEVVRERFFIAEAHRRMLSNGHGLEPALHGLEFLCEDLLKPGWSPAEVGALEPGGAEQAAAAPPRFVTETLYSAVTHWYMFDTGFPPDVLAQLAMRVNEIVQLGVLAHLACFHNPKIMARHGFAIDGQLSPWNWAGDKRRRPREASPGCSQPPQLWTRVLRFEEKVLLSMEGSGEGKTCYLYTVQPYCDDRPRSARSAPPIEEPPPAAVENGCSAQQVCDLPDMNSADEEVGLEKLEIHQPPSGTLRLANPSGKSRWMAEEESILASMVREHRHNRTPLDWLAAAQALGTNRTQQAVRQHWQLVKHQFEPNRHPELQGARPNADPNEGPCEEPTAGFASIYFAKPPATAGPSAAGTSRATSSQQEKSRHWDQAASFSSGRTAVQPGGVGTGGANGASTAGTAQLELAPAAAAAAGGAIPLLAPVVGVEITSTVLERISPFTMGEEVECSHCTTRMRAPAAAHILQCYECGFKIYSGSKPAREAQAAAQAREKQEACEAQESQQQLLLQEVREQQAAQEQQVSGFLKQRRSGMAVSRPLLANVSSSGSAAAPVSSSQADIAVAPPTEDPVATSTLAPKCAQGCVCKVTSCLEGSYKYGFNCNICGSEGTTERWHCQEHQEDICLDCNTVTGPAVSSQWSADGKLLTVVFLTANGTSAAGVPPPMLGLKLTVPSEELSSRSEVLVQQSQAGSLAAETAARLGPGLVLLAVGGEPVASGAFGTFQALLAAISADWAAANSNGPPLKLLFGRRREMGSEPSAQPQKMAAFSSSKGAEKKPKWPVAASPAAPTIGAATAAVSTNGKRARAQVQPFQAFPASAKLRGDDLPPGTAGESVAGEDEIPAKRSRIPVQTFQAGPASGKLLGSHVLPGPGRQGKADSNATEVLSKTGHNGQTGRGGGKPGHGAGHGRTPDRLRMCEDCGVVSRNFALPKEGISRWCGGCAKTHGAVNAWHRGVVASVAAAQKTGVATVQRPAVDCCRGTSGCPGRGGMRHNNQCTQPEPQHLYQCKPTRKSCVDCKSSPTSYPERKFLLCTQPSCESGKHCDFCLDKKHSYKGKEMLAATFVCPACRDSSSHLHGRLEVCKPAAVKPTRMTSAKRQTVDEISPAVAAGAAKMLKIAGRARGAKAPRTALSAAPATGVRSTSCVDLAPKRGRESLATATGPDKDVRKANKTCTVPSLQVLAKLEATRLEKASACQARTHFFPIECAVLPGSPGLLQLPDGAWVNFSAPRLMEKGSYHREGSWFRLSMRGSIVVETTAVAAPAQQTAPPPKAPSAERQRQREALRSSQMCAPAQLNTPIRMLHLMLHLISSSLRY